MPSPGERVAVSESMNPAINRVGVRCNLWGMKLNATKTMIVSRSCTVHPQLSVPYRQKIYFFVIWFYAIVHRSIVQNKILSIICSCSFFVSININWPNRVNMWLANPNGFESLNFHSRRIFKKGHSTPKWMDCDIGEPDFQFLSKYIFFK